MDKLLGAYIFLQYRFAEPSTHAALSSMAGAAGLSFESGMLHNIMIILSLGFGCVGFWKKEARPLTVVG